MRRMAAYYIDMVLQRKDDHSTVVNTSSVQINTSIPVFCVTCYNARPWHIYKCHLELQSCRHDRNTTVHANLREVHPNIIDVYVYPILLLLINTTNELRSMIASAVALPDDEAIDDAAQHIGVKRRLSDSVEEEKEQESKRQRVSPGKNSPTTARDSDATSNPPNTDPEVQEKTSDPREARRKSTITDEKQRSKRLFGALLGSLNQPKDRTVKRRQEIESRRKAELQRQDDERLEDKQRRQQKLAEQRKKVQVKVEEENVSDNGDCLLLRLLD